MYSLLKKFLERTTVHLRRRLDAGYIQERRRQVDVQNYVVYSATSYRCFIVIQYCSWTSPGVNTGSAKCLRIFWYFAPRNSVLFISPYRIMDLRFSSIEFDLRCFPIEFEPIQSSETLSRFTELRNAIDSPSLRAVVSSIFYRGVFAFQTNIVWKLAQTTSSIKLEYRNDALTTDRENYNNHPPRHNTIAMIGTNFSSGIDSLILSRLAPIISGIHQLKLKIYYWIYFKIQNKASGTTFPLSNTSLSTLLFQRNPLRFYIEGHTKSSKNAKHSQRIQCALHNDTTILSLMASSAVAKRSTASKSKASKNSENYLYFWHQIQNN